ncbi:hypothetical protein D918_07811 [Trichuris suis]|nr:hypothetical protein D918_07811 [Trichuris suis]
MGPRQVSNFVRIRLCIRYALREGSGDLISAWKLLYGVDLNELPTVKDVLSNVSERLDLGNFQLSIFSKDYEIPTWCSSQVFDWDDELDIWILPPTLAGQKRNVTFPSPKLINTDSSAKNLENVEQFASKRRGQFRNKELVVEQRAFVTPSENGAKPVRSKRNLEKVYDKVSDGDVQLLQNTEDTKKLKLTGKETVKDLSNIALPYEMPKKKKKKMLKRQRGAIQQDNVSFLLQFDQEGSTAAVENNTEKETGKKALSKENNVDKRCSDKIIDQVMELDDHLESYLSDWKQAQVVFYNPKTNEVILKGFSQRTPAMFDVEDHSDNLEVNNNVKMFK